MPSVPHEAVHVLSLSNAPGESLASPLRKKTVPRKVVAFAGLRRGTDARVLVLTLVVVEA